MVDVVQTRRGDANRIISMRKAMNEKDGSTARGLDTDTAPDLSKDGWPEKLAKAPVRRGRPPEGATEGIHDPPRTGP